MWNVPDDPATVGTPEEPKGIKCERCGEVLTTPWLDCDCYYLCQPCVEDCIEDTKHAPEYFREWLKFNIDEFYEYTLPEPEPSERDLGYEF